MQNDNDSLMVSVDPSDFTIVFGDDGSGTFVFNLTPEQMLTVQEYAARFDGTLRTSILIDNPEGHADVTH